jgi:hypothetical protein
MSVLRGVRGLVVNPLSWTIILLNMAYIRGEGFRLANRLFYIPFACIKAADVKTVNSESNADLHGRVFTVLCTAAWASES